MATIEKISGKSGDSYRITVAGGFDCAGKRIRHRMTFKPEKGMTSRQIQKAVQRAAADFERSIEQGYALDNRQTFAEYAAYVLELKERDGTKTKTLDRYKGLMVRINQAIGHMKLIDIRPQHLNTFYKNLAEPGVRMDEGRATAKIDMRAWMKENKKSRASIGEAAGVAASTVSAAVSGKSIQEVKAKAIAEAMGKKLGDVFTVVENTEPLSEKTILAHHRLISMILAQAEKEMLVPYNAAAKATPPKAEKNTPNYFQPETISQILKALEAEPLKWQLITHLLLVTGCRRGEIIGLKWEKIDLQTNRIKIDSALLSSPSKGVYESTTKTSDVRYLTLPAETMLLLKDHRREQLRMQLANGDRWIHSGYVFTQDNGDRMNPDSVTAWLYNFSKRHNLPHINPHAFRHTAVSTMIAYGVDLVTTANELGHANASTTASIYAHQIAIAKAKAADVRAGVFAGRSAKPKKKRA